MEMLWSKGGVLEYGGHPYFGILSYSILLHDKYIKGWNNGEIDMKHFVEGFIDSIIVIG